MTTQSERYVGIDVSKTWLDIAFWGDDTVVRVHNDEADIAELVERMVQERPERIAVEATGGYEQLAVLAMLLKGLPVAVINPTRVRALSKAKGKLGKTDAIDARLIAEYAYKIQPEALEPKEAQEIHLKELVTRREQLVDMRAAEKNRLGTATPPMQSDIREHIDWLGGRIQELEDQIRELVANLPNWQEQAKRLDSIPGVGFITVVTVMAEMPELGQLNRQQIAALAGLAPYNRDSGKKRGARRIFGGRKGVRRVLYMACLSAIRCNPTIRSMYERLIGKGKIFKVAITACMRKLLTIMNGMTRTKTEWQLSTPSTG